MIALRSMSVRRAKLEARLCRSSFYDFFLRFWPEMQSETLVNNWHIEVLCKEFQTVMGRVFRREPKEYDLLVNVPPGSTKSTILSIAGPVWCWVNQPELRFICGSHGHDLSLYLGSQSARLIESDHFREVFPEFRMDSTAMGALLTWRNGQRRATSPDSKITGFHAHAIIVDDPLDPNGAISEATLRTTNRWIDLGLLTRVVKRSMAPLIVVMQRLSQGDCSGHVLAKAMAGGVPVRHICFPAELRDNIRPRSMRSFYKGGLFDPVRLPQSVLETTKKDMGSFGYAGQFDQSPVPLGGGMFRTQNIQIYASPDPMKDLVRYWDKAGTSNAGAFTVGALIGRDWSGKFWVLDVVRGQWEVAARERTIKQTAEMDYKKWGRRVKPAVEVEPGSGGKDSGLMTLRNLARYGVRLDKVGSSEGSKILRAEPFSEQVNGGNVCMVSGPWNEQYVAELRYFPYSKYKDQVDASSGAFNILTGARKRAGGL